MSRVFGIAVALSLTALSMAQGTFTIRRPADGSTVREIVKVRIPKKSIPAVGYIGIEVNDKFIEAVSPVGSQDFEGNDFVYKLDTKARGIADGRLKITAYLYGDFGTTNQILGQSSVTVKLDNRASIKAPAGGFRLRYKFPEGRELVYNTELRQSVSTISEAQAKLGGRAAELPREPMLLQFLYSFEHTTYNKGRQETLLRMQPMPKSGKDYAYLQLTKDESPRRYYSEEFASIYMQITDTGRETFGRMPAYWPMEGSVGQTREFNVFGLLPLPALPTQGVKPGDSWNGFFLESASPNLNDWYSVEKLTKPSPARGTLETIEYEGGRKCARIRNKLTVGNSKDLGTSEFDEVFWLDIERGVITRLERNQTVTVRVREDGGGGGGFNGGEAGARGGNSGGASAPGVGEWNRDDNGAGTLHQDGEGEGEGSARRGGGRGQGRQGPPGPPGQFNRGGGGTGSSAGRTRILRQRFQVVMTLAN